MRALWLTTAVALTLLGCKTDEFKDAKVATAPEATAPKAGTPQTGGPAPKIPGIPKSGQLPADHPPVGATGPAATDKAPRPRVPVTGGNVASYGKTGPLLWTAPAGWQGAKPASSMRLAEYLVEGQAGAAVVSIFFGLGGGVDANMKRWAGQFKDASGAPSPAKRTTRQVAGLTVHLIDVAGNYNAGAAMMGGAAKSDQRVLGAIVETPKGPYFFKLLGPAATVTANEAKFTAFVDSFKPGQ